MGKIADLETFKELTLEQEKELEQWEKDILEENKIHAEKREEREKQIDRATEEIKRILREKHPEMSEAQILKLADPHPRKDLEGPKADTGKYYQALFGNRNFCIKCRDNVWRQPGKW